jgi:flagellar protein FlaI
MATDDKEGGESDGVEAEAEAEGEAGSEAEAVLARVERAAVGEYTWEDFRREFHTGGPFDRTEFLGFDPRKMEDKLLQGASAAKGINEPWQRYLNPERFPVTKDAYTWEHYKREYYYDSDGQPPTTSGGEKKPFQPGEELGFDPREVEGVLSFAEGIASEVEEVVDERTVDVNEDLDEDAFFSTVDGRTTVVSRYDLEKAVPQQKKTHFTELERYWVNKPYACVIIFHSRKENEKKYYVIEPYLNSIEDELLEFLSGKLKTAIKYSEDDVVVEGSEEDRAQARDRAPARTVRSLRGRRRPVGRHHRPDEADARHGRRTPRRATGRTRRHLRPPRARHPRGGPRHPLGVPGRETPLQAQA